MKRLLVALVATLTLASVVAVLVQPNQAGAATVQNNVIPAKGDTSWTGINGADPHSAAVQAKKDLKLLESECAGQPSSTPISTPSGSSTCGGAMEAASVSVGLWTYLLTLNHAETGSALFQAYVLGYGAAMGYVCGVIATLLSGPIAGLFIGAVCVFILTAMAATIVSAMVTAYNHPTWLACFDWWVRCTSNAVDTIWGYIYPVDISGFNILFTWGGVPIAWQENDFSG